MAANLSVRPLKTWLGRVGASVAFFASMAAIVSFITGKTSLVDDKVVSDIARSPWLGLQVMQDGHFAQMTVVDEHTTRVKLKPGPFELRFPVRPGDVDYALCAWTDSSIFSRIRNGIPLDDTPYFGSGRGFADAPYTSATLFVSNEGHNFLGGERLGPDPAVHSVQYSYASFDGKEYKMRDFDRTIDVVLFSDINGNRQVDAGEYEFFYFERD